MVKPKCLDLFCGSGGAAQGYINAGFSMIYSKLYLPHTLIISAFTLLAIFYELYLYLYIGLSLPPLCENLELPKQ